MPEHISADKTQRLVMALELLALIVAAVLILIDYKLKRDLVILFRNIEGTLATSTKLQGNHDNNPGDSDPVSDGSLVGDVSIVEETVDAAPNNGHGQVRDANGRYTSPVRDGRARDTQIPQPDKPVGS